MLNFVLLFLNYIAKGTGHFVGLCGEGELACASKRASSRVYWYMGKYISLIVLRDSWLIGERIS